MRLWSNEDAPLPAVRPRFDAWEALKQAGDPALSPLDRGAYGAGG